MALLLRNIIFTFSSRLSIVISALIISVLTARFLGPVGRGEYFYIYSLVVLLAQFCTIGLQTSNTYVAALQPQLNNKLTLNSVWVSAIFSTIVTAIVVLAIYSFTFQPPSFLWLAILLTPLYLFYLLAISLCAGAGKINLLNYYQLLTNFLTILAVLVAGYFTKSITLVLLAICVAWLIVALGMFFSLYDRTQNDKIKFHYDIYRMGFSYSFKAYIIGICTLIVLRTNVFLLRELSSFNVVGYYSIAAQITDAVALLPSSIALLLFPHLVKSKSADWAITYSIVKKIALLISVLLVLIWFFSPWVINLLFGYAYMPSVRILRYMLPGAGCSCLIIILTQFLAARGFPISLLFIWIGGVGLNLGLSYWLILWYGAIGAAIGISISYGLILTGCVSLFFLEQNNRKEHIDEVVTI